MRCDHVCVECDKSEKGCWMDTLAKRLRDKQLCFNCDFWIGYVRYKDSPKAVRINGNHYWLGSTPASSPNSNKGYGGCLFRIKFSGGRKVRTTDLWHQGEIPERFQARLPDNAEFVDGKP